MACKTALEMEKQLSQLRDKWKGEGEKWPSIVHSMNHRIGINAGNIVVGNMGSEMKLNYTMTGDQVNLTARLESSAKQLGIVKSPLLYYPCKLIEIILYKLSKLLIFGKYTISLFNNALHHDKFFISVDKFLPLLIPLILSKKYVNLFSL